MSDRKQLTEARRCEDDEGERDKKMDPTASFDIDKEIADAQLRRERRHEQEADEIFGAPPGAAQRDDAHEARRRGSPVGALMETTRAVRAQALQWEEARAKNDAPDGRDEEAPHYHGTRGPGQGVRGQEHERRAQQEADDMLENMAKWIDRSGDDPMVGEEKKDDEDPTTPTKRARRSRTRTTTPEKLREEGTGRNDFHMTEELAKEMTPTQAENTQEARQAEARAEERRASAHRREDLPRPAGQPSVCGPPHTAPRRDDEQVQRPEERGERDREEQAGDQTTQRAQEITSLADLANLIKNENAMLKRDLGDRLRNVENDYVQMAEAQQQLRERQDRAEEKQQRTTKQLNTHDNDIRELKATMKKTTTVTADYMKDVERRIQGLEKVATSANNTRQEAGTNNVVVIRGFARDTKRSDIVDFLQGLLKDIAYDAAAEA